MPPPPPGVLLTVKDSWFCCPPVKRESNRLSIPLPAPPALTLFTGAGCFDIIGLGAKVTTCDNESFLGNLVSGSDFNSCCKIL